MERRKLVASLFVISCCLLPLLCGGKGAQAETVGEDSLYLYQEETQTLLIKGKGEDTGEEIASGYELVDSDSVIVKKEIKHIIFGTGITKLSGGTFGYLEGGYNIEAVVLETVTLGKSIQTIADYTFEYYASTVKNIEVDPENPYFKVEEKGLYSKDGKRLYAYPAAAEGEAMLLPGTEELAPAAFAYSHITKIEIPASVKALSRRLFTHCEQLEELTFAKNSQCVRTELNYVNVTDGPSNATFSDCPRLTEVRFGENFKKLAADTFYGSEVQSVYFGKSFRGVTTREGKASKVFCDSISDGDPYPVFYAPQKIEVSKQNPYFKTKNGVLLSKDGKKLYAYPGGRKNTSYTLPASVEIITERAFFGHRYLGTVHAGKNITTIGKWAFEDCYNLKKVSLGKKIKTLKAGAFEDCHKLTTIVNLEKVEKMGEDALSYTGIIYFNQVMNKDSTAFRGNAMSFYMPAGRWKTTWSVTKGKKRVKILARSSARLKLEFKKKGKVTIQARQGSKKIKHWFYIK